MRRTFALPFSLIAFGLLYFATVVLTDLPDPGDSDALAATFYADSGNRVKEIVTAYLAAAAAAFLILIVAQFARAWKGAAEDALRYASLVSGSTFAALYLAAHAAFVAPAAFVDLGYTKTSEVDPTFARTMSGLGDPLWLGMASVPAGIFLIAVSWGLVRRELGRRWLGFIGTGLGVLTLLSTFFFFGVLLVPLWAALIGIGLLIRTDRSSELPS